MTPSDVRPATPASHVGLRQRRGAVQIQRGIVVECRREHAEDALEPERGGHGHSLAPGLPTAVEAGRAGTPPSG